MRCDKKSLQLLRGKKNLTGFTLVELIVVITILVILGTIAFVSLSGFSGSARDSSRVSDLSLISKGLDIHYTKLWSFPIPTSSTGITFGSSSSVVWYQGTIGEWVIRSLGWAWARISTKPVDPLSKEEYRYSLPTGVNEYLLAADYEGDSVALLQNWGLRTEGWGLEMKDGEDFVIARLARSNTLWGTGPGEHNRASDLTKEEDLTWIASLRSQWLMHSFFSTNAESRGIFELDSVSASTGSPTISYLKGTYNNVATRVTSGSTINIIALPSIFLASGSTGTIVDGSGRNFLLQGKSLSGVSFAPKVVYSSWALPSNDTERLLFSSGIVAAYSGTVLATNSDIKSFIDNVNSTGSLSAVGGNFVRNKFGGNGPSVVVASSSPVAASYDIANSLMFNGSNQFLNRTPSTPGNRQKWTWSGWVKRGKLGTIQTIFSAGKMANASDYFAIEFNTNDQLEVYERQATTFVTYFTTTETFRDPGSWVHIAVSVDTTIPSVKIFKNGSQITSFSSSTIQWAGTNTWSNSTEWHRIGRRANSDGNGYFDGYLSDVYLIDGVALDPTAFAQSGATAGQWVPKAYTGVSAVKISQVIGTATGTFTSHAGLSALFDENTNQNDRSTMTDALTPAVATSAWVGKSWWSAKTVSYARCYSPTDQGFGSDTFNVPMAVKLQGSNNGSVWNDLGPEVLFTDTVNTQLMIDVPANTFTSYNHHRVVFRYQDNRSDWFNASEVYFYEGDRPDAYGTNGFHLDFSSGANLGVDTSGNANNWTTNGAMSPATNQFIDTPTNNFPVFNPTLTSTNFTYGNGNLSLVGNGVGQYATWSTLSMSGGSWYWEVKCDTDPAANRLMIGLTDASVAPASLWGSTKQYVYTNDGSIYNGTTMVGTSSWYTTGDMIGLKYDGNTLSFYKNNVLQSNSVTGLSGKILYPMVQKNSWVSTNAGVTVNFWQWWQSGLNYDAASGGWFKYAPPAGFKVLSSKNIGN